jgi:cysteine-rich repeat protein
MQCARRGTVVAVRVATVLFALLAAPRPANAHGPPIGLAFWGEFPLPVARCQRIIGRAAAVCGLRVWRARRDCALAALRGTACDHGAAEAAVDAARVAAIDDLSGACTPQHLSALQFLDLRDAQQDVIRFCREVEAATTSLVLEPLASAPPEGTACGERTAWASTRLLADAFRSRQQVLGRIATSALGLDEKRALAAASTAGIGRAAVQLTDAIAAACPPATFASAFGRDPADLFAAVAARADCLAGDAYAQSDIVCPPPRCGNRIREGGEECDDGNARDGDGCSAACRREVVTSGSPS